MISCLTAPEIVIPPEFRLVAEADKHTLVAAHAGGIVFEMLHVGRA